MRKIITLLTVCMLSIGAWAATYTYTVTVSSLEVEDLSSGTNYKYKLVISQKAKSGSSSYTNTGEIYLLPETHQLEGSYSFDAGTLEDQETWLLYKNGSTYNYRTVKTGSTLSITKDATSGKYTLSGYLVCRQYQAQNNHTYNYNYNTNPYSFYAGPFADEPDASSLNFSGSNFTLASQPAATPIVLDIYNSSYATLELQFNVASELTAGTYNVTTAGENGTILASAGFDKTTSLPLPSSFMSSSYKNYYITGGSVTVSYSQDLQQITIAGSLTTAHGSTITVNSTGVNPWAPAAEIDITVTQTSATMNSNGFLNIEMTGTPNNLAIAGTCTQITDLTVENLNASYTYVDLGSGNTSDIDKTAAGNSLSIVATGNAEEYSLSASIVCKNGNTYNVENVVFTCHIPTAWDDEEATSDFTFTANTLISIDDQISSKGWALYTFENSDNEVAKIAIPTTTMEIAAGEYTFTPSAGKSGTQYAPSVVLKGWYLDEPYFLMSGSITLAYSADLQTITMTGTATTYRGTTVTLNLSGVNPDAPKEATFDVETTTVTIATSALTIDVVGKNGTTPKEAQLTIVGQNQPIVGTYELEDFDSWSYVWVSGYDYAYLSGANTSATIAQKEGSTYTLNANLICDDGYTYFINGAEFTYSMVVSDLASPVALLTRAMDATVDLTVQRTLYCDGSWNTICLPFDWTIGGVDDPLAGATVAKYVSASKVGEEWVLVFETANKLEAGQPYLIRWAAGSNIENPVFKNATIKVTEGATVQNGNIAFKGILEPTELVGDSKRFVTENNVLSYVESAAKLKGFRAYFETSEAPSVAMRFVVRGAATSLKQADSEQVMPGKMIENGQLIIRRDNKKFNAIGQEL